MRDTIKRFAIIYPCCAKTSIFFLWEFSIIMLLISSWSLHPSDFFRHPFCLHGSTFFCSKNEYVYSVTKEVNSLYVVDKDSICLYIFGLFISLESELVLYLLMLIYLIRNSLPSPGHFHSCDFCSGK